MRSFELAKTLRDLRGKLSAPGPREVFLGLLAVGVVGAILFLVAWGTHDQQAAVDQAVTAGATAAVAPVVRDEAETINTETEATHVRIGKVRERAHRDVEVLQAAVAAAPPGDPDGTVDRAYFERVCAWRFYIRDADCVGYGGGPEGPRPADRP